MSDDLTLLHEWLEVLPEGRFDDFSGEIAEDFVLRLPFVPPGIPTEFAGRETVRQALQSTAATRSPLTFEDVVIRRTDEDGLYVVTARGGATMNTGKVYRNQYVLLVRLKDGVVLEHTEYLNPLAVMEAMG